MCCQWVIIFRAFLSCLILETVILHTVQGLNVCMSGSATSCEECLLIHPRCAWCTQMDFGNARTLTSRCDLSSNLQNRGCDDRFIEYPRSTTSVLLSKPLSAKGSGATQYDVIQIMPQEISLSLRPGERTSFEVQVRQVEDYPVDLYYLMDLSLSMKDDLDTIRNLGTKLADEMGKLTSNFRLGFGSFVDKNMSPFSYTASKYQENPCNGVAMVTVSGPLCAGDAVREKNGSSLQGHLVHVTHIERPGSGNDRPSQSQAESQTIIASHKPKPSGDTTRAKGFKTSFNSASVRVVRQHPLRSKLEKRTVICDSPTATGTCVPQHYATMGSFDTLMARLSERHPEMGRQKIVDALLKLKAQHQGYLSGLPLADIVEMTSDLLTGSTDLTQ